MYSYIDTFFRISESRSSIRTEVIAGATTFLAMSYIVVVNPAILSEAGMDFGAVFVATCLAAAFGSLLMGVLANYPIGLAPGMGQNAFFTYGIVLGSGHTWQAALGAVFVSGLLFLLISVLPVRAWIINAIPKNLKLGISAGIGLFIAFIALKNAGIVVANPATLVGFGDLTQFSSVMALVGLFLIAVLVSVQFKGAIIVGMIGVSIVGWLIGDAAFQGVIAPPPDPTPVLLQMDVSAAIELSMLSVVLTLLLVDVFDTAGTLVGVANRAKLLDEQGRLPRIGRALLADSGATIVGASIGTSSTTSFIESAAGVESGGRTGLTAVVVAGLFLLCLLLSPLAQSVPAYATAGALLFVSASMARGLADLDWRDPIEYTPAILTAICMPLSFSIANGIGVGFISYAAIKLIRMRPKECPIAVYLVAMIFTLKFVFLGS
jgi:AGZA family xanthine/uracil permease-like MFS transporter